MVQRPMLADYVTLIMQLFKQFMQPRIDQQGVTSARPLTYLTERCSQLLSESGYSGFVEQHLSAYIEARKPLSLWVWAAEILLLMHGRIENYL